MYVENSNNLIFYFEGSNVTSVSTYGGAVWKCFKIKYVYIILLIEQIFFGTYSNITVISLSFSQINGISSITSAVSSHFSYDVYLINLIQVTDFEMSFIKLVEMNNLVFSLMSVYSTFISNGNQLEQINSMNNIYKDSNYTVKL